MKKEKKKGNKKVKLIGYSHIEKMEYLAGSNTPCPFIPPTARYTYMLLFC